MLLLSLISNNSKDSLTHRQLLSDDDEDLDWLADEVRVEMGEDQGRPGELWQKLQWLYWRLELCDRRLRIVKSLVQESSPTSNNYLSSPFPKSNLYEWLILWCLGLFMSNTCSSYLRKCQIFVCMSCHLVFSTIPSLLTNGSWLNLTTGWDKVKILVLQCLQL